jgi:hypothetical protein
LCGALRDRELPKVRSMYTHRVFCKKSLDLFDCKRVDFSWSDKEFVAV